jgi:hypothetical protein
LLRNYLLNHVIEGKVEGKGTGGRIRKQLLNDFGEIKINWKLRE